MNIRIKLDNGFQTVSGTNQHEFFSIFHLQITPHAFDVDNWLYGEIPKFKLLIGFGNFFSTTITDNAHFPYALFSFEV